MSQIYVEYYQIYGLVSAILLAIMFLCYLVFSEDKSQLHSRQKYSSMLEKMLVCMHDKLEKGEEKLDSLVKQQNTLVNISNARLTGGYAKSFRDGLYSKPLDYNIRRLEREMTDIRREQKYLKQLLKRSL